MPQEIESYQLGWHPQRGCLLRIKVKGGIASRPIPLSPADLAAVAQILRESPVYAENGWIHTGGELVEDHEG
jgi:hypothetical protein